MIQTSVRLPSLFKIALRYLERNYYKDIQLLFERLKKDWKKIQRFQKDTAGKSKDFGNKISKYSPGFFKMYTEDKIVVKRVSGISGVFFKTKYTLPNGKQGYEFIIPAKLYYRTLAAVHSAPYMDFLKNKKTGQLNLDFL